MSLRLCSQLIHRWDEMDGYAVAHRMGELGDLPLGRLCSFIYWRMTDGADGEAIEEFRAQLWQPPRGVEADARSPWSAENETSAFMAVKSALGA